MKTRSANAGIVLQGFTELEQQMMKLPKNLLRKVITQATQKAMKPVVAAARANLKPGHGLDTGLLKKSMGIKTKRLRFASFTVVGPRVGFKATVGSEMKNKATRSSDGKLQSGGSRTLTKTIDPVRYAHLVEFGHTYNGIHVAPMPFMRPAFDQNVPRVLLSLREALASGVIRYATVRGGKR